MSCNKGQINQEIKNLSGTLQGGATSPADPTSGVDHVHGEHPVHSDLQIFSGLAANDLEKDVARAPDRWWVPIRQNLEHERPFGQITFRQFEKENCRLYSWVSFIETFPFCK
jgi:hypothetical protein